MELGSYAVVLVFEFAYHSLEYMCAHFCLIFRSFGELAGGSFCVQILGIAVQGFGSQHRLNVERQGSKITKSILSRMKNGRVYADVQ